MSFTHVRGAKDDGFDRTSAHAHLPCLTALVFGLRALALAGVSSAVLAGQHSICFEGELSASRLPTGVYGCSEDAGGSCQIVPRGPGMALIQTSLPGGPPGTYRVYSLPTAGTFPATINFYDNQGRASGTRTCGVNAIGPYGYGARGWATAGAQLTGFTTDASGLVTTGVWKLVSPTVAAFNRVTLQVPADFVAVGGGAQGAETPNGALVAESYQSDTLNSSGAGDWRRWTARTTELAVPQAHQTTVYAIGLRVAGLAARDLKPLLSVVNQDSHPTAAAHPVNQVSFASATQARFVFLSGGVAAQAAPSNSSNALGQFVTATAPILTLGSPSWCSRYDRCALTFVNGWRVESKDHAISHPGTVNTALLALPPTILVAGTAYRVIGGQVSATSGNAAHPAVQASGLRGQYALTGIGAAVDWKRFDAAGNQVAPGNLIWKLQPRPDLGGAAVASKDHLVSSPARITAHAMGIRLEQLPPNYALGALGFGLDQSIAFTGTSQNTNSDGAPVKVSALAGSAEAMLPVYLPSQRNLAAAFSFWFTYPSGPSSMGLDLRFVLDGGTAVTPWTRFRPFSAPQLNATFPNVPAGHHKIEVQARGVLISGPPISIRLCGTSDCYFAQRRTDATLSASAAP